MGSWVCLLKLRICWRLWQSSNMGLGAAYVLCQGVPGDKGSGVHVFWL
jgi:hypothetical protein